MFEFFDIDLTKASFEWDEEKDRINFLKHGIHFRTAAKVFLDPKKMIRKTKSILKNSGMMSWDGSGKFFLLFVRFRNGMQSG